MLHMTSGSRRNINIWHFSLHEHVYNWMLCNPRFGTCVSCEKLRAPDGKRQINNRAHIFFSVASGGLLSKKIWTYVLCIPAQQRGHYPCREKVKGPQALPQSRSSQVCWSVREWKDWEQPPFFSKTSSHSPALSRMRGKDIKLGLIGLFTTWHRWL